MSSADQPNLVEARVDTRKGRLNAVIKEDVTSTHVPELRRDLIKVYDSLGTDGWTVLYLDIRNARLVDSMGMNWLFAESVRLKELQKDMVLRVSSPAIFRVIQFAGLDKLVTVKFRRRKQTR